MGEEAAHLPQQYPGSAARRRCFPAAVLLLLRPMEPRSAGSAGALGPLRSCSGRWGGPPLRLPQAPSFCLTAAGRRMAGTDRPRWRRRPAAGRADPPWPRSSSRRVSEGYWGVCDPECTNRESSPSDSPCHLLSAAVLSAAGLPDLRHLGWKQLPVPPLPPAATGSFLWRISSCPRTGACSPSFWSSYLG